jgi:pre-mRNA-splicing factor RBM22/SLT11
MASVKRDDVKQKWEETEFPLVCETCLGDNPYVRMTKEDYGKKCQICESPFTVFAWQAGTKGRLKKVEICRSCAQAKNVCQVCIYDLQYGLPVQVRDKVLRDTGSAGAVAAVPQSMANRSWYTAQQQRALDQGQNLVGGETNALAHAKLRDMARMEPRYERNLAKLCSFFARGECDRGDNCPFRHEMPKDRNDPLSQQNTKDRFYGTSDPVANKMLGRKRQYEQDKETKDADAGGDAGGYDKSRATLYARFQGDPPFPNMTEMDIRDNFYSFGEIVSVRAQPDRGQAFVEYTEAAAAELAIASMNRKDILSRPMYVSWARAPKRGDGDGDHGDHGDHGSSRGGSTKTSSAPTVVRPVAPPGGLSRKPIPKGLAVFKPPPEVAAMAAARKQQQQQQGGGGNDNGNDSALGSASSVPRPFRAGVPRPGGGPVRGAGVDAAKRTGGGASSSSSQQQQPYYPSADPSRLGSKS